MVPLVSQENNFQSLSLRRAEHKPFHPRKNPSQSEKGHDLWLYTLSDLLLLLMIFFLVLFGMTLHQQPQGLLSLKEQATSLGKSEESPAGIRSADVSDSAFPPILASLERELISQLGDEGSKRNVSVTRHANYLVLTFPERIIFDLGRAEVKPSVQPILDKVASLASHHPQLLVEVQGHTDDRPINTQRYPSNWELSVDRATQVAKALIGLGLDPGQLTVKGFGEYRTLYPNDSDSNRHKNRRVEIQFFLIPPS